MSQLLTFGDLKTARIAEILGVCPADSRFNAWANEAEERMLNQGRFWGSIREAQFCVTESCIVYPREIAHVERVAVCGEPMDIHGSWYQYTKNLASLEQCSSDSDCSCSTSSCSDSCSCGEYSMRDRTPVCSFSTTLGVDKTIRTYPTSASDVGKKIIYQGYDKNSIWVRTLIGGVMSDGEEVTLALPYADTTTIWGAGAPTGVIKDATVQRLLVYEYDTTLTTERLIATYQPGETRPLYRVGYIPHFSELSCCGNDDACDYRTVTAMVKLQHVQFTQDNDWLVLQNLAAYKQAMLAVKAYEEGDIGKGDLHFFGTQAAGRNARGVNRVVNRGGAIPLLQAELRTMTGDRTNIYVHTEETNRFVNDTIGFI